jgi:AbrB family looped-hinge helix DNA binding protein
MPISTVSSKGQITIPKEIRDELGLKPGDRVNVFKDKTGQLSVRAINTDFRSLRGILKSKRTRPLTLKEMDEAIARGASRE